MHSRISSTRRTTGSILAVAALALALASCDSGSDSVISPPSDPISDPATDPITDTRPSGQEFSTQERVDMLLGSTQEQAENLAIEFGWTVRVGRVDDEQFMLTEDYQLGRMTIELDSDDTGTPVVTSVTVELDGGPQTFTA